MAEVGRVVAIDATQMPTTSATPEPPTATPTAIDTPESPTATPTMVDTPTPAPGEIRRIAPTDGMIQIFVPAGEFLMGSGPGDPQADEDEMPQRVVTLGPYWIDETEITNAMYGACVAAGACSPPAAINSNSRDSYYPSPEFSSYPVVFVDWVSARDYCAWAGRRLPTEAEWEKAARGSDGRIYPWGDSLTDELANFCDGNCAFDWRESAVDDGQQEIGPVGSYPDGGSYYQVLDLAGNVYEWMADWYDETYYEGAPAENPLGPLSGSEVVIRGGSWYDGARFIRAANRVGVSPSLSGDNIGFRCAEHGR
jgi:formylglycine-generating enzyme required for sulfatase activity